MTEGTQQWRWQAWGPSGPEGHSGACGLMGQAQAAAQEFLCKPGDKAIVQAPSSGRRWQGRLQDGRYLWEPMDPLPEPPARPNYPERI